jgi:polar amino acid transport system permease protein
MKGKEKAAEKKVVIDVGEGAAIPIAKDKGLVSAWWVSLIFALGALAYLLIFKPDPYWKIFKFVPDGILVTFEVTFASIAIALVIGLITGLGRISQIRIINLIASTYVEIVRGIPLLVQLFYIYYAVAKFIQIPAMAAAILAMSVCYGAYMGEVFRAGIESIDWGQTEAAMSLGFNRTQTMFYVVLPQAWRTILPPVGNEFIALLKDTSLVSILAVADLLRRGREYASTTFDYFETYTLVAIIYLLITLILSKMVSTMEDRLGQYEQR